jgi:hypothetical protein
MSLPTCRRCGAEHTTETLISKVTGECFDRTKCDRYLAEVMAWLQARQREEGIRNLKRLQPIYKGITT